MVCLKHEEHPNSIKFVGLKENRANKIKKYCIIITVVILALLILGFILVFVGFPILFMCSIDIQRFFLFEPITGKPEEFSVIQNYVPGMRNLYVTVDKPNNISLGVWHFLPQALLDNSNQTTYDFVDALNKSDYPVLLHFHGNGGNRIYNLDVYKKFRRFFHIIGFDYRGYGDSSKAELTEEGLVQDCVELYKWLQLQTTADIFIWGHSMGTAVATHTIANLHDLNIIPAGLTLESPYTTLEEEALNYPLAKILTWLPWFNVTMLNPIKKNGFLFETAKHILKVDCPIMILHAEDDNIIPYFLSEKLYAIAEENRNLTVQGNVTLHLFPAENGYEHWGIYTSPLLTGYIKKHIEEGRNFTRRIKENDS